MRASIRSLTLSSVAGAVAGLWLCGTGAVWAGDGGGADLATLNDVLGGTPFGSGGLCVSLNVPFCPQTPTITQAVLQIAAWNLVPTEMIRATNAIPLGGSVNAGNPSIPPVSPTPPPITSALPITGSALSTLLANLTPIGFMSAQTKTGAAAAVPLYNNQVDTLVYAVASLSKSDTQSVQPDRVYFFYEDLDLQSQQFLNRQTVAKFSFPLTKLNTNGIEDAPVITTLQVIATCNGGPSCLQAQVISGLGASTSNPIPATQFGIGFGLTFATSQFSANPHAIFQWGIPSLITGMCSLPENGGPPCSPDTDSLYFFNPIANIEATLFVTDNLGAPLSPPASLPSIGLAPSAAPFGPRPTCTPTPPATTCTPPPSAFALCASLPQNGSGQQNGNAQGQQNGGGLTLVPAVGAYYAMATTGEMLLSAPLQSVSTSVCPPL
jgi:hypothetical protein